MVCKGGVGADGSWIGNGIEESDIAGGTHLKRFKALNMAAFFGTSAGDGVVRVVGVVRGGRGRGSMLVVMPAGDAIIAVLADVSSLLLLVQCLGVSFGFVIVVTSSVVVVVSKSVTL